MYWQTLELTLQSVVFFPYMFRICFHSRHFYFILFFLHLRFFPIESCRTLSLHAVCSEFTEQHRLDLCVLMLGYSVNQEVCVDVETLRARPQANLNSQEYSCLLLTTTAIFLLLLWLHQERNIADAPCMYKEQTSDFVFQFSHNSNDGGRMAHSEKVNRSCIKPPRTVIWTAAVGESSPVIFEHNTRECLL